MMNYGMYPGYYQPLVSAQERINQFNQMIPQQVQQQQTPQQSAPQMLNAIPVSTIEEAKAYIVDPLGVPTLFYNAGKNEVYLKRTNKQTAEAEFFTFAKTDEPLSETKEENIYEKSLKTLNDKIDGLYSLLEPKTKKVVKNDE